MRLQNKTAVITGGASGIGKASAERLAAEGAEVVILDVKVADETVRTILEEGGRACSIVTDVSDPEQVKEAFDIIKGRCGGVDILVCAAAVKEKGSMLECSLEQWDRTLAVNLNGVMFCTQTAGRLMADQGKGGKIVILSSLAAIRGRSGQFAYVSSKGTLTAFVQSAAMQLGQYGITVNAVAPGIIDSENPECLPDREEKIDHIPMKRVGTAEDIAGAVLFFSSEDSAYVSGVTMPVDGAFSIRLAGADF